MDEATCSICGQNMECHESMKNAKTHICKCIPARSGGRRAAESMKNAKTRICEYCTQMASPDLTEQEIKKASLEERRISEYFPDAEFLHNYIYWLSTPAIQESEKYLETLSKKDILEQASHSSIRASLEFMLRQSDPEAIRKTRQKIEREMRKTLKETCSDEKKINERMKAFESRYEELLENQCPF